MNDAYKYIITGTDRTKRMFTSIKASMARFNTDTNRMRAGIAGLVGVGGFGMMIKNSLAVNDSLAKTADRLGLTTEALAGLRYGAELTGTPVSALDMGLQRMTRRLGQVAATGKGEAKEALDLLGVSIDQLDGRNPDQQFKLIAEALGQVEDQSRKVFIAQKLFDSEGVKLVNLLNEGADGIAEMQAEAEELGIALNRIEAAKIEAANDALTRSQKRIQGVSNDLTVALAPIIVAVSEEFVGAGLKGEEMSSQIYEGVKLASQGVGVLADGVHGIKVILKGGEILATAFGAAFVGAVDLGQKAVFKFAHIMKHGLVLPFQGWLEILARVPGMSGVAGNALEALKKTMQTEWKPPPAAEETLKQLTASIKIARGELQDLLLQDLPSEVLAVKLRDVFEAAEIKAIEIAAAVKASQDNNRVTGGEVGAEDLEGERDREKLQARLQRLDESYASEMELLRIKLAEEKALLDEALAAKEIDEYAHYDRLLRAQARFDKQSQALEKKGMMAKLGVVGGTFRALAGLQAGESKKMFEVQKAASLAQAAVALPAAVMETFKQFGYPWGIAPAAAMAATGAAQIAAISSQSFGGGGVGGISLPGSNAVTFTGVRTPSDQQTASATTRGGVDLANPVADSAATQPQSVFIVQVQGDVFSQDSGEFQNRVQDSMTKIFESDAVIIPAGGAQAAELLG